MKKLLTDVYVFVAATFKIIIVTIILIAAMLIPAIFEWGLSITLILGIISLSLTVLAGTDFIKKNTKVRFKKDGEETDLWLAISIAISIVGVIALWIDNKTECIDKLAYTITVVILSGIVAFSTYLSCKEKKAP